MWAYAVNRTLEQGLSPDDGLAVIENVKDLRFETISGTGYVNHKGDRNADRR